MRGSAIRKTYRVTLVPSALTSKLRLSGKYKLRIDNDGLDLYVDSRLKLFSWPFGHIKSFWNSCKNTKYGIYAGGRCQSGEGEIVFQFECQDDALDFQRTISNGIKLGFKDFLRPVSDQVDYRGMKHLYDSETTSLTYQEFNRGTLNRGIQSEYFISILPQFTDSSCNDNDAPSYAFVRGRRTKSLDESPVSNIH